jgi:CheY-like chemotaxis protein
MVVDYRTLSLLVVEKDTGTRMALVRLLRKFGVGGVIEAADGSEALVRCDRSRFDAILADVDTEPMDGLTFLEVLRQRAESSCPAAPVILTTRKHSADVIQEARRRGASAMLLKPIDREHLKQKLERVLGHA